MCILGVNHGLMGFSNLSVLGDQACSAVEDCWVQLLSCTHQLMGESC
jgi:hypothetical protein